MQLHIVCSVLALSAWMCVCVYEHIFTVISAKREKEENIISTTLWLRIKVIILLAHCRDLSQEEVIQFAVATQTERYQNLNKANKTIHT